MRTLVAILLLGISLCLYSSNSNVIKLTSSNFQKEVIDSSDLWLVEFYAPWCGHCKNLAPEWEKAATALKGIIKIGAVDADSEKSLGGQYGIQGFPTIKFFSTNKKSPIDYQGGRTADSIVNYAIDRIKEITSKRLNPGRSSSTGSSSSSNSGSSEKRTGSDKDVIVLTDDNFDQVMNSKDMWLVEFYAPWCGHCKNLEPHWNQAATELKGKIKVAKLDATVHNRIAGKYGIRGYPTIKIFPPGPKSDSNVQEYDGPRESAGIVTVALEKLEKYGIIPDVEQLTNQNQYNEVCTDRTGVCIIAFLPHLYDSTAEQRKSYIEEIKSASKNSRGKPIYYLWSQGGDYYPFEERLSLAFGYPAVVAINSTKKKYAVLRSSFSSDNIKNFVNNLLIGKEPLMNLPDLLPKLKTITEWDGNDIKRETPKDEI